MQLKETKPSSSRVALPDAGFVRLPIVLSIIPVGRSTWWKGISEGRFPRPVRLGPRTVAWRVEDIRALIERLAADAHGDA